VVAINTITTRQITTMVVSMTIPVSKEQFSVESPVVVLVQPSLVVMDVGGQSPWELSVDPW
jgi:hypothetical protein